MLLIKNAEIYTMAQPGAVQGDLLIGPSGKIERIGSDITAPDARVIDATGLVAVPGLVDAHTHIGLMDFSRLDSTGDANEMTRNMYSEADARYGTDLREQSFTHAWQNGTTTVCITPGSGNLVNGLAYACKTYGQNIFDMVIKHPVAFKIAFGGNPKRTYGERNQAPASRMSMPALLRDLFECGREYIHKKESGQSVPCSAEMEAVALLLSGQIPAKMHCTQFDMVTAIEIAREFGLSFSLEHAWGASMYMDEIVNSGCSICFGPIGSMKKPGECDIIDIESVVELDRRNVLTSIITDSPLLSADSLVQHAGEAVRHGLPFERALAMITINPAKILGVDDRVGSLVAGKDGDVVLFDGKPTLDTAAKAAYTICNGEVIYSR